jgi:3-oxoacyl-[acyl-carrier-protein] synthase I
MRSSYLNALGVVSALGQGKQETLANLMAGNMEGVSLHPNILANKEDLEFGLYAGPLFEVPELFLDYASRNSQLALTALEQIRQEVFAAIALYGKDKIAVVIGTSTSGVEEGEKALENQAAIGTLPLNYNFIQQEMGATSEFIARILGVSGPAISISTACTSSAKAFGTAKRLLDQGICDAVVVGGVDSFCKLTINGFSSLSALHSGGGCLPFSDNRSGTVLGEAATLFLMSREKKGCLLASIGESTDAYNMTSPDPSGTGAIVAMKYALCDAGLSASAIDYVNLHGTGTRQNDAMESIAINDVFKGRKPALSSTKPLSGHTLGAAGALEVGFCWLSLSAWNQGYGLPVHAWDGVVDAELPVMNFVKQGGCLPASGMRWCMSNSYAFGGSNASVILGKLAK